MNEESARDGGEATSEEGETCEPYTPETPDAVPEMNRRRVLAAMGGTGTLALAGCLGDEDDGTQHLVGFLHDDQRTEIEVSEDEKLLYPALDADVDIPYRCEVGRCGDCTVKYDGDATDVAVHDGNEYLSDEQISNGWILTCVGYARDGFDAEVTHPDDD